MPNPVADYVAFLHSQQRTGTALSAERVLTGYETLLATRQKTPGDATADDLTAYQHHLSTPAACLATGTLALSTQATHLAVVRSFHRWLLRRGFTLTNPAQFLVLPKLPKRTVNKDELSQQEAQALLETAAAQVESQKQGSVAWALALRDIALIALGLASGLRRKELCEMPLSALDVERNEIRIERHKGGVGRVLPIAGWAMSLIVAYRDAARTRLLRERTSDFLFIGTRSLRIGHETLAHIVTRLQDATVAANPDLTELAQKHLTSHSLRVTYARLLFANGCPIRSINELLLHNKLSTTALYTPVTVDALRQELMRMHPRC